MKDGEDDVIEARDRRSTNSALLQHMMVDMLHAQVQLTQYVLFHDPTTHRCFSLHESN